MSEIFASLQNPQPSAEQQQANAWLDVAKALHKYCPGWINGEKNGVDSAVDAIRNMAERLKNASDKPDKDSALSEQVGGDHYRGMPIQPIEYIHANNLGFAEGCVVKYVSRWKSKNGIADLEKARHFLELLIELEKKADKE